MIKNGVVHETYISTQQNSPDSPSWVSYPHGNSRRTQGFKQSPPQRPQAFGRVIFPAGLCGYVRQVDTDKKKTGFSGLFTQRPLAAAALSKTGEGAFCFCPLRTGNFSTDLSPVCIKVSLPFSETAIFSARSKKDKETYGFPSCRHTAQFVHWKAAFSFYPHSF